MSKIRFQNVLNFNHKIETRSCFIIRLLRIKSTKKNVSLNKNIFILPSYYELVVNIKKNIAFGEDHGISFENVHDR